MSHSLPRKYFKKLTSNLIGLASGLVVTSVAPRVLGPLLFGQFAFVTEIFAQIFILLEGGSSNALYNKVSQDPRNVSLVKIYSRFLWGINILVIASLGISIFFDLSRLLFADIDTKFVLMGFLYASLFWTNSIYLKVLDGLGATAQMEQQRIYTALLRAAGILILLLFNQITLVHFFALQISLVLFLNFAFLRLIKNYTDPNNSIVQKNPWQDFYSYSAPLFMYGFVSVGSAIADRWLLQHFSGFSQQGFFSLATQLGAVCFLFSSSMTPLFHREIAITSHNNDLPGSQRIVYQSFPILFFVAAILGVFCSANAEALVKLVAGPKYAGNNFAYALMFLYPIHQTYGQLAGSLYYASGNTKTYRNIGIFLLLNGTLTSFILLAPAEFHGLNLGFTGLAIKNVGLQLLNVHILLYFSFRKLQIKLWPFFVHQFGILAVLGALAFTAKYVAAALSIDGPVCSLLIGGILYLSLISAMVLAAYRWELPLLMRYTKDSFEFAASKLQSFRTKIR